MRARELYKQLIKKIRVSAHTAAFPIASLEDILHQDSKLYLVFEYMQMDLKKYLDTLPSGQRIDNKLLKVSLPCVLQTVLRVRV